jgi:hypothetical protein
MLSPGYRHDIKKAVGTCDSNAVVDAFFSRENIERLQSHLRIIIQNKVGYTIDRQNETELVQIMRAMYSLHGNPGANDPRAEAERLNTLCLQYLAPHVTSNIRHYLGYLRDISRPYTLLDRPKYASLKGERVLQLMPRQ